MRRNRMFIVIGLLLAVLAVGAVACDDNGDGNGDDGNGDGAPTATEARTDGEEPDSGEAGGDGETIVTITALDDSGVTGTATLTQTDDGLVVVVTVDGGLEEGSHANHVHEGTCDDIGGIGEALDNLEAGADGSAPATTTTTDAELSHLIEEGHSVAVHSLDGTIIACGDIEAS